MRRAVLPALLLLAALAVFAQPAFARAGFGMSMGSRGGRTYVAPPSTGTAPYAMPFQRSITPQAPAYGAPSYGGGYGYGYRGGSPFLSGLMGGLIGAGIGGLLFGHGLFHGINGFGGFFGFLLQIFLLVLLGRWLFRTFFRSPAMAGGGMGGFARGFAAFPRPAQAGGGGGGARPVTILQADYLEFEQLLKLVQQAWSAHDLTTLSQICSPEMLSYFSQQLADQTSRGARNLVSEVRLERGDLSEAWAEQGREYATVAMRFSMIDVTRDAAGRVVDGSLTERVTATELWTFARAPGGRWILSAIQQGRG
jgi:predicted lipid-binding transport protein (Tim44 family)